MSTRKLITVPVNGQISIGKKWAGKEIVIEEINDTTIKISSGVFIPDSDTTFHTKDAKKKLEEFEEWSSKNPAKKTDLKKLRAKLGKKRQS